MASADGSSAASTTPRAASETVRIRVDSNLDSRGLVSRSSSLALAARLEVHERLQRHNDERSGKRGSEKIRIFLIRAARAFTAAVVHRLAAVVRPNT